MDKNLIASNYLTALEKFLNIQSHQDLENIFLLFPNEIKEKENDPMFFYHQDRWFLAVQMLEQWAFENNWFCDIENQKLVDVFDLLPEHFAVDVYDDISEAAKQKWLTRLKEIYTLAKEAQ